MGQVNETRRFDRSRSPFFEAGPPRTLRDNVTSALAVAGFGFLCLLAVGAVLLIGAKLQEPDLGAGASPISIFNAIAIVSLGVIGTEIQVGDLSFNVIPLAGLLFVALGMGWAARRVYGPHRSLGWSVGVGFVFGGLCALIAATCELGLGSDRINVAPQNAFVAALISGTLFSLIRTPEGERASPRAVLARLATGRFVHGPGGLRAGLNTGLAVLTWASALGLGGAIVYAFARSSSVVAAVGIVVHAIAFLPNLAVAIVAFAMGAPVEAGFGTLRATQFAEGVPQYSLFDWHGGLAPAYLWLPTFALAALIVVVGMRAFDKNEYETNRNALLNGAGAALVFAWLFGVLAGLGEASVGADLTTEGFFGFSVPPGIVFGLALVWAAVGLAAGTIVSSHRKSKQIKQES